MQARRLLPPQARLRAAGRPHRSPPIHRSPRGNRTSTTAHLDSSARRAGTLGVLFPLRMRAVTSAKLIGIHRQNPRNARWIGASVSALARTIIPVQAVTDSAQLLRTGADTSTALVMLLIQTSSLNMGSQQEAAQRAECPVNQTSQA